MKGKMKKSIPFSPPDMTDEEVKEVIDAIKSGWITTGPKTKQFEKEIAQYCGTERAVCLNSATACLEMTLRLLGIGEGDEVITSAYTYTASCSPIIHVGAKPILIDTATDSTEMDYEALERAITERTKVIIPVDIAGIMCDYDKIFEIVERKRSIFKPSNDIQLKLGRIAVIADGAHSFGAVRKGKRSGSVADFTTFSFHAVKNLTTAEGGAVAWNNIGGVDNEDLYKQYQLLSLHGQSKDALAKTQLGAWEYDIAGPWYKCNMTDIAAGIGLAQLHRYEDILAKRKKYIKMLDDGLKDLDVSVLTHYGDSHSGSGHLYICRLCGKDRKYRDEFIIKMAERGVATNVHYKPLPMHTGYMKLGFDIKNYPNAKSFFENEITLPLNTKMTEEDVEYVIETFKEVYANV